METAQYKNVDSRMVVDVDTFIEEGRWYARMWNKEAVINTNGAEIPASPWCLELSEFGKHYKPVAPLPKLGGN